MSKNCYCDSKNVSKEEGLPAGYCGFCDICHRPGHVMPFPGASPQTGAWCGFHYWAAAWISPNGRFGFFVWLGLTIDLTILMSIIFRDGILAFILRIIIFIVLIFISQNILYFILMTPRKSSM